MPRADQSTIYFSMSSKWAHGDNVVRHGTRHNLWASIILIIEPVYRGLMNIGILMDRGIAVCYKDQNRPMEVVPPRLEESDMNKGT